MNLSLNSNASATQASLHLSRNNVNLQKSIARLSSGKRVEKPSDDAGGMAVAMKLESQVMRSSAAMQNILNAISLLEVQDGVLSNAGKIVDRMSELKGLASQDPMKSAQDRASYNNEFKDLQVQLYDISQMKFNGVSLFANHTTENAASGTVAGASAGEALFGADNQSSIQDHTLSIFTSADGAAGSKVSIHKSILLSALTIETYGDLKSSIYSVATSSSAVALANAQNTETAEDGSTLLQTVARGNSRANGSEERKFVATLATASGGELLDLQDISVGVITKALENIAFLRAQNGGTHSRLAFNSESLIQQKTNMRAALGRMSDVDFAEETTNLAKYQVLSQASASILAQANANTDLALMLLR